MSPVVTDLHRFKSIDDLDYNMTDHQPEKIKLVISRTDHKLIRYTNKKVFFLHPFFTKYACDIFGDIYTSSMLVLC